MLVKLQAKPATLLKLTLLHGCFSRLLNCTNGTKLRNAPQMFVEKADTLTRFRVGLLRAAHGWGQKGLPL